MKLNIIKNILKKFAKLGIVLVSFFFNYEGVKASNYVFYCKPWKDQISKISKDDNFSIELENGSLSILGGGQISKFANLIFTHPNFYIFASPSGSLIIVSRNDGPKNVRYWEIYEGQETFYSSVCNN